MVKETNKSRDTSQQHDDINNLSFENAQTELEAIVERMERGQQQLEQSLSDFERGVALMNHCHKLLSEAEQKVDILVRDNNELFTSKPFTETESINSDSKS